MDYSGKVHYIEVRPPSDRSFGYVIGAFFFLLALWPILSGLPPRWPAAAIAAVFVLAARFRPSSLARLNKLWFHFGLLLHRIASPLALGIVFFVVVTPIGLILRFVGHDSLRRSFDASASSYWCPRETEQADNMENQF